MTFDLVPTQDEGVLSVSLLVQRRREMAHLVLTKAFPQPNTTDTIQVTDTATMCHCLDQAGINLSIYSYTVTVLTRVQ